MVETLSGGGKPSHDFINKVLLESSHAHIVYILTTAGFTQQNCIVVSETLLPAK